MTVTWLLLLALACLSYFGDTAIWLISFTKLILISAVFMELKDSPPRWLAISTCFFLLVVGVLALL